MANNLTTGSSKGNVASKGSPEPRPRRFRLWPAMTAAIILILGYSVSLFFHGYAREVAIPVEKALTQVGAEKKCSEEHTGRGFDNQTPWYDAYYEIPGTMDEATEKIRMAFEKAGLKLTDGPYPPNPMDNRFFSDHTSRKSPYSDLNEGNVRYLVTVYGQAGNKNGVCGRPLPYGKTAFYLTVNLPEFR